MKKVVAVIVSLVLVLSSVIIAAGAMVENPEVEIKGKITKYPVVMVPGYSGSHLMLGDSPEDAVNVWHGFDMDEILPHILHKIAQLGIGLGVMNLDNADYIARVIHGEMKKIWPYMACNPDGTSEYDVHPYYTSPEQTNSKWISDNDIGHGRHDVEIAGCVEDYIGRENIYNFADDWRMGAEQCAKELRAYIKAVKKYAGVKKVNLHAISQGGQIAATYLALYGWEGDVDNAVLSSPAIGGAALASDLLSRKIDADEHTLIQMIEQVSYVEEDYEWLVKATRLGFLDDILNALVPYLSHSVGYWPSIWDFIPQEHYEELKKEYLSAPECAPLVKQSDRFHYEILPVIGKKLRECRANGMNISIITGSGSRALSGEPVYSDTIVPVASATGATCAPYGKRFADGYVQAEKCGGKYKISPDMTVDASTCYLPDNTWFADGNYHAWTYFSDITNTLSIQLLLTDKIKSVYDDPAHPQFLRSDNESKSIVYDFNGSVPGYISGGSTALTVRNVMNESSVRIKAVYADSLDITFDTGLTGVKLKPGESAEIPFRGSIPEVSGKCVHITVYYTMSNATPLGCSSAGFTVMNGNKLKGENKIIDIENFSRLDRAVTIPVKLLFKNSLTA